MLFMDALQTRIDPMKQHVLVMLALVLSASGCASRNVIFNPSASPSAAPQVTRVFMDREGDIYPSVDISNFEPKKHHASLKFFFQQAQLARSSEWTDLTREYGLPAGSFDMNWQVVQDSIIERTIRRVTSSGGAPDPIIVVIHGYNNEQDPARTVFDSVRKVLGEKSIGGRNPSFVEIYWDGRTDLGSKLRNMSAWNYAQHNAYSVGLTLRRILSRFPAERPVRILTHSHGGKVASVALWNVRTSIDCDVTNEWLDWYNAALVDTLRYRRPEHPDLRVGILVPAMPGNVIGDINPENSRIAPVPGTPPTRLIIGRNVHDFAVGKHFLGLGGIINSAWGGSTTLGARPGEFEAYADEWNIPGGPWVAFCVDFSGTEVRPREHDWTTYMRREAIDEFLALLFTNSTPVQYRCRGCGS
jgi:hypothetical protein